MGSWGKWPQYFVDPFIDPFFNFLFWLHCSACGILVPRPGIESVAPAVKLPSPNHWTTGEFPFIDLFNKYFLRAYHGPSYGLGPGKSVHCCTPLVVELTFRPGESEPSHVLGNLWRRLWRHLQARNRSESSGGFDFPSVM